MSVHAEWQRFEQQYRYGPQYAKEVEAHYLDYLRRLLILQGWTVIPMRSNAHWDLTLHHNGKAVKVEVKIARPRRKAGRDGEYYQFKIKSNGGRPCDGDFVICACASNGPASMECFVIPSQALGDRATIEITSSPTTYEGQWAPYLNAWSIL